MLRKARPGPGAMAPRSYTPRTGGGHAAVLARFTERHVPLVQRANDLRRERDELHPSEEQPIEEAPT